MRRIARLLLYVLAAFVLMVAGGLAYLFLVLPRSAPAASLQVPRTPNGSPAARI